MVNLKERGVKAFIWDFFGKMSTHGMGFIVTIFLARLLEPSDFGLIAIIMVIIGIASVFTDVGLGGAHSAEKSTPCSLFFCLLFQHRYWFSKDRIKEEAVIEVKYISDVLIPNLEDALALNFNVN